MIVLCRTKSNDGSGISNGMLRKYDIETGSSINSPIKECGTSLSNSISLVPIEGIVDAGIVSVNASNGSIAFYSLGSGRLLHRFFGQDKPCSTASSSDGFFYIVGTEEGDLRGWETKSGRLLFYVHRAHLQQINLIAMSSDNSHFVTASADGNVKIWSVDYLSASEFDKTHSIG